MKSKYTKREEAQKRQEAYSKLTPIQRIENCINRRGENKKELQKLSRAKD